MTSCVCCGKRKLREGAKASEDKEIRRSGARGFREPEASQGWAAVAVELNGFFPIVLRGAGMLRFH